MGKFQAVHKYFFIFVTLAAWHGSLVAHGRKIRPLNQHSLNHQPSLASLKSNFESAHSLEDSVAGYTDAFRPTTPGGSPGVGHGIVTSEGNKMVAVQSPNVEVSVTEGSNDDFKPTDPGHSPGVGHAYPNKIGHAN